MTVRPGLEYGIEGNRAKVDTSLYWPTSLRDRPEAAERVVSWGHFTPLALAALRVFDFAFLPWHNPILSPKSMWCVKTTKRQIFNRKRRKSRRVTKRLLGVRERNVKMSTPIIVDIYFRLGTGLKIKKKIGWGSEGVQRKGSVDVKRKYCLPFGTFGVTRPKPLLTNTALSILAGCLVLWV